jgi:hypothetical protein
MLTYYEYAINFQVSPPLDESMDNKPNAALAALLMCPDTRQVSALITGALPSAVTPPRHIVRSKLILNIASYSCEGTRQTCVLNFVFDIAFYG